MKRIFTIYRKLLIGATQPPVSSQPRRGATLMEYAVLLTFILVVCIVAIQHIGSIGSQIFKNDAQQIPAGRTAGGTTGS